MLGKTFVETSYHAPKLAEQRQKEAAALTAAARGEQSPDAETPTTPQKPGIIGKIRAALNL